MSWTLGQGIDFTLEHRERATRQDRSQLNELAKFFGSGKKLDNISTSDVDRFVAHCKKRGNKNSTIHRKLNMLSAVYRDAMRRDGCSHRPFLPSLRIAPGRTRYLTADEELAVTNQLLARGKVSVSEVIITLIDTGMRFGEVLALRPCDCNLQTNMLEVWENKGDLPRSVPMTDRVREIVTRRCQSNRSTLFCDVSRWQIEEAWRDVRKAIGLADDKDFVLHALRHTCASRLVQRGASLYAVQKVLGHSTIKVTEKYSHLNPEALNNTIALLNNAPSTHGGGSASA